MRPSGPLPPQVYWVRRLLALGVAVLMVSAIWWLLASKNDGGPRMTAAEVTPTATETTPTGRPTATLPSKTSATKSPSSTGGPTSHASAPQQPGQGSSSGRPPGQAGERPGTTPTTSLESPTGDCDPSVVDMSIDVSDSVEGRSNAATFIFQLPRTDAACSLAITPDTLVTRVTSGPDVVWSSGDCPDAQLAKEIVVRADPATVYQFLWNGRRSTDECKVPGTVAPPGGYWVEAALVGGEPQKAYFDVVAPPRSARR